VFAKQLSIASVRSEHEKPGYRNPRSLVPPAFRNPHRQW